jgi:hypothetical protein
VGRGRPVGILVILLAAATWALVGLARCHRQTGKARELLDRRRTATWGLASSAYCAPALVSGPDLALAYALTGSAVLSDLALLELMPSHRAAAAAAVAAASGCGSSCGSSCGGGCGGGCGGCGGCS